MRRLAPLLLLALALPLPADAGDKKERKPVAVTPEAPPPAPAPPAAPPPPPPGWNTGMYDGGAVPEAPEPRLGATLRSGVRGALVTDGARVYVSFAESVVALEPEGKVLWSEPLQPGGAPSLAGQPGQVLVGGADGLVYTFDPATGSLAGRQGAPGAGVVGQVLPDGRFLTWVDTKGRVSSSAGWSAETGLHRVPGLAVDTSVAYVAGDLDPTAPAPVFAGERPTAAPDSAWHLVAADRDGVRWRAALTGPPAGPPALDLGHVFVPIAPNGSSPGGVDAFTRDGLRAWSYRSDYGAAAPLCVAGALVVLPDRDGKLYGLDAASGKKLWELEGFGPWTTQPVAYGKLLLAANADGTLHGLDLDDGGSRWNVKVGAALAQPPVRVGKRLVLLAENDRLTIWEFE